MRKRVASTYRKGSRFTFRQLLELQCVSFGVVSAASGGACDGGNANRLGNASGRRGKDQLVLLTRTEDLGNGLPGDQVRDVEELTASGESAARPIALEKLSHGGVQRVRASGKAGAPMRVSSRPYRNPQQVSKVNSL